MIKKVYINLINLFFFSYTLTTSPHVAIHFSYTLTTSPHVAIHFTSNS